MASPDLPAGIRDTPAARVANRLHSAAIHLLRAVREADRASGLSPERLSLLSVLAFAGPKTVGELAEAEQVSSPAISRILNGLEDQGLVERERLDSDRRFVRVRMTKRGWRVMEAARAERLKLLIADIGRLGREELSALSVALGILEELE